MDHEEMREIRIDPVVPSQSVLISTARGKRPRREEAPPVRDQRDYVGSCPFCRGNEQLTPPAIFQVPATGEWDIRIVENLYPVLDDVSLPRGVSGMLHQAIEGHGHHEVIVDHFRHGIALHQVSEIHLSHLLGVYRDRMRYIYSTDTRVKYILLFKNFGPAAGASIPHTHSQLIAMPIVPHNVHDEAEASLAYHQKTGTCIFCALLDEAMSLETTTYKSGSGKEQQEYLTGKYIVEKGERFVAVKPFASRYEWEVHILPVQHQSDFLKVSNDDFRDLAIVLRRTMARLHQVVGELQYNFFLHTVPFRQKSIDYAQSFHWHIEICPRTSILSGFELGSGLYVNTISPEEAASRLRRTRLEE